MDQSMVVKIAPAAARVDDAPVEIVERKGLGHPDSLSDGVAEALSIALARRYREETGALLHFNMDKVLLAAGQVERSFGGGRILRPITLYVGDRATTRADGRDLGIPDLVRQTARDWFARTLPHLDVGQGLNVVPVLAPGSAELARIFRGEGEAPANDTSAAVGYAPFTPLERMVLALEAWLQEPGFRDRFPEAGEDVKVLAVRRSSDVDVTLSMPFLARQVPGPAAYCELRDAAAGAAAERVRSLLPAGFAASLTLNALDDPSRGSDGVYLTLGGTSAEHGDSGEVGRGNRASGLISLMRPAGAEAAAGKNPRSHVGKIYGVLAFRLAAEIAEAIEGVAHATVWLVSRIGAPVARPQLVHVEAIPSRGFPGELLHRSIEELVSRRLRALPEFCLELEQGRYPVY